MVEDINDNVPIVGPGEKVVCENEGNSVVIVAEDHDQSPFSSPFIFNMPADSDGQWSLTRYNGRWMLPSHSGVTAILSTLMEINVLVRWCSPFLYKSVSTQIHRTAEIH